MPDADNDADPVAADDVGPGDFEPERLADEAIEATGYGADAAVAGREDALDAALDDALDKTFPASDPVSANRRSD